MEFFDSLICELSDLISEYQKANYPCSEKNQWTDVGYSQVILQRDTAFELDGVGFNLVTSSDVEDGIVVVGDELCSITADRKFARVCLVQLEDSDNEQDCYKTIKKVDYVKYHFFPEGYMIRTTSRSHKESVRVAKSALKKGISFEKAGNLLISKYKENPKVKAVKVIFVTASGADYKKLEAMAQKSGSIAETLNHIMNNVKFDCDTCNLKPVCDEVEGMKELHFKNASMGV
ncbi:MAG: carbon monoxide dehydrogenase [Clostridia bacterium]|nr:carbon monoxide dehydrogenase [Clostridia bacterium]MBQ5905656.1 carbon monoxide dehydrogenase [Clostridia bacterium]